MSTFSRSYFRWVFLLSLLLSFSCGRKDGSDSTSTNGSTDASTSAPSAVQNSKTISPEEKPNAPSAPQPKMIVRNGDLTLESTDHERTMQSITNLVTASGGYISNQSTRRTDDAKIFSELTVRIPVEHFDSVLVGIKKTGSEVVSENISAEDQTKRYYDLEGHLAAKKLEMAQMQDLMKSAKSMTDIIAIKKEILDLQADLDDIEGVTKQIANEVSYSTLRIEIMSRASNAFFPKMGTAIGRGFSTFGDVLGETITFVISKSPVFAAMIGFIYLIMWMSRRGGRKEKEREKPTLTTTTP